MTPSDNERSKPLLTLRTALVLLLAALCAVGAGVLLVVADRHWAEAALVAIGAFAAALKFFDGLID